VRKVGFLGVVIREWDCGSSEACSICCSQVEVGRDPSYGDMK